MIKTIWEKLKAHPWVGAVVLLFIIALCVSVFACVPDASARTTSDVKLLQVGDTLQVSVFYTLRGADSAKYTVFSTNGKPAVTQVGRGVGGKLIFNILGPAEGETDTVTIKPVAYKAGVAFAQADIIKVHKRNVTAPPVVTDSVELQEALLESKVIDTVGIASFGEVCQAELRSYRGKADLMVPLGSQTAHCASVFDGQIREDNLREVASVNAGYPWTAKQDSIWRLDTTYRIVTRPQTVLDTRYYPNPMSGDTIVYGAVPDTGISIAVYRQRHSEFSWP